MPINKKALTRYLVIDSCIRSSSKYDFKRILEAVNARLTEEGFVGIGRTQLYKDLNDLEFSTYKAPIERVKDGRNVYFIYTDSDYSIVNQPINEEEANQIKEALMVLSRFKGMPQFEWVNELIPRLEQSFNLKSEDREIISFDNNEFLIGIEHLGTLFNAIIHKSILKIKYKSFKSDDEIEMTYEPHFLKQYNNRWFLFGYNSQYENLTVIALDRIKGIEETGEKYTKYDLNLFVDYFEDIIGVTRHTDREIEEIVLKFSKEQAPYIKTKPLHGSQKLLEENESGITVQLELIPNYELESLILGFGEQVQVLSPKALTDKITSRLIAADKLYKT